MTPRSLRSYVLVCAAVAAFGTAGCGDEDEAAPVPQPSAQQQRPSPGAGAKPQQPPGQLDTGASAPPAQGAPRSTGGGTPPPSAAAPGPPAPQGRGTNAPPPAMRQPGAAATPEANNDPEAQARQLIEQLSSQAAQSRWKEADQTMAKLRALRGKVSADLQTEIDNAATFLQSQKAVNTK